MEKNLITFGKYKGQPVEVLAADKEYTEWLLAQSWFKEKNINLYTVIINNFREPLDTPEHNKMQIKFLNLDYRLKFALYVNKDFFKFDCEGIKTALISQLSTSEYAKDLAIVLRKPEKHYGIVSKKLLTYSNPNFENVDVAFRLKYGIEINYNYIEKNRNSFHYNERIGDHLNLLNEEFFQIEIKPTVSDDFPAVLRQMKASMPVHRSINSILFLKEYTGIGANEDEFVQYFKSQGYKVIFEREIEEINLPKYDLELVTKSSEISELIDQILK